MKGSDIDYLLRDISIYGGVLASDQLKFIKNDKIFVVNTKPSTHRGQHWTVIDTRGPRWYFFDSFGRSPSYYGFPKMKYWTRPLQGNSDTCGLWCCYYIVNVARNKTPTGAFKRFKKNKNKNDEYITRWVAGAMTA